MFSSTEVRDLLEISRGKGRGGGGGWRLSIENDVTLPSDGGMKFPDPHLALA